MHQYQNQVSGLPICTAAMYLHMYSEHFRYKNTKIVVFLWFMKTETVCHCTFTVITSNYSYYQYPVLAGIQIDFIVVIADHSQNWPFQNIYSHITAFFSTLTVASIFSKHQITNPCLWKELHRNHSSEFMYFPYFHHQTFCYFLYTYINLLKHLLLLSFPAVRSPVLQANMVPSVNIAAPVRMEECAIMSLESAPVLPAGWYDLHHIHNKTNLGAFLWDFS